MRFTGDPIERFIPFKTVLIGLFFAGTVQLRSRAVVRFALFTLIAFTLGREVFTLNIRPDANSCRGSIDC